VKTPSTRHCTRCLCAMAWRWTSRQGPPLEIRRPPRHRAGALRASSGARIEGESERSN
jgi:hypothetical protein